jgi:hypothetical protein
MVKKKFTLLTGSERTLFRRVAGRGARALQQGAAAPTLH